MLGSNRDSFDTDEIGIGVAVARISVGGRL
jgi:hypothetical protein